MKLLITLLLATLVQAAPYQRILLPPDAHPAIRSAAAIIARELKIPSTAISTFGEVTPADVTQTRLEPAPSANKLPDSWRGAARFGDIVLFLDPKSAANDGYKITFQNGIARVSGARPRSLLYAAGDLAQWKDRTTGVYLREPSFAIRTATYEASRTVADYIAELGVNILIAKPNGAVVTLEQTLPEVFGQLSPADQARLKRARAEQTERNRALVKEAHDADVQIYAFLFGNDPTLWSRPLYNAAVRAWPSIEGTSQPHSHETGMLCPSDPLTWKFIRAYVEEFMDGSAADGMYATFWDHYGMYCQDDRCKRSGLDQFSNELYENVKQYREAMHGKPLVVRTWSSGSPHWLGENYVHAPGYDHFGGSGEHLWGRVIKEDPADIIMQSKVYDSDCEPDPRFSPLIGKARPHTEIAEYQESGQTIGRFYFPASSVDYITWTMRKAHGLIGASGGVNVFPGGTMQSDYSVFDDILNSINLYAWRELAWNVNADPVKIWNDWATPIYGAQAAPHIIKALRLSEEAVNRTFSPLGMGSSTNSDFARTIDRRETLLQYTNRYFLPDYAKFLEPTQENIERVHAEKVEALRKIDEMIHELDLAKPYLTRSQAEELTTRFDWFKEFAICNTLLDESLWRYRYLRYLAGMLTTDKEQLRELAAAFEVVKEHNKLLFRYDPQQKFTCYTTTLGQLRTKPALGSPIALMKEIYDSSVQLVEKYTGP